MLIAEPPQTRFDVHFRLFGFPLRIHPMFWLIAVLLGIQGRDTEAVDILLWIVALLISIIVHELGHAFLIRHYGWRSRIILYHFGGLATIEEPMSYVETYNENDSNPKAKIIIALAGPSAGFLLAGAILAVLFLSPINFGFVFSPMLGFVPDLRGIGNLRVAMLVWNLLFINIFWGLVNLLPVYPLDGGQVARELFSRRRSQQEGVERSLRLSMITGCVVAGLSLLHFSWQGSARTGIFLALMFGVLAFMSYRTLQQVRSMGGMGGHYGRDEYDEADWWKQ